MRSCISLLALISLACTLVQAEKPLSETALRDKITAATVFVNTDRGYGTGWVVDSREKLIITAGHVVEGVSRVSVITPRKNKEGWIISKAELFAVSPQLQAEVMGVVPHLDLAILKVPELNQKISALPLSTDAAKVGTAVYAVSHAAKMPTIFNFDKGTIEFTGFAAVTTSEPGRPSVKLRAEIFAYQCKGIDRGSSGCALVNGTGEVIGIATMGSGLHGSKKVNCVGVSVQELQHLIKQKKSGTQASHQLLGRWVGKFDHAPAEMGVEFKSNGQLSFIIPGGGKIAGIYRVEGDRLHVTTAGKKESMQLEWLDGHSFRLITPQFTAECKRHDGGLQ